MIYRSRSQKKLCFSAFRNFSNSRVRIIPRAKQWKKQFFFFFQLEFSAVVQHCALPFFSFFDVGPSIILRWYKYQDLLHISHAKKKKKMKLNSIKKKKNHSDNNSISTRKKKNTKPNEKFPYYKKISNPLITSEEN